MVWHGAMPVVQRIKLKMNATASPSLREIMKKLWLVRELEMHPRYVLEI